MGQDWPTPPKLADYSSEIEREANCKRFMKSLDHLLKCLTGQTKCGIITVYFSIRARNIADPAPPL
jgi:hypothetical protein